MSSMQPSVRNLLLVGLLSFGSLMTPATAQEVRYSYLDMSFISAEVDKMGTETPVAGQTVDYDAGDGDGIRFRGVGGDLEQSLPVY